MRLVTSGEAGTQISPDLFLHANWDDASLERMQSELAAIDLLGHLAQAMETELASALDFLNRAGGTSLWKRDLSWLRHHR